MSSSKTLTLSLVYSHGKRRVAHCLNAIGSFNESLSHLRANKGNSFTNKMVVQLERLARGERMSNRNFPKEGKLPNNKHFRALKYIPLRGYCWSSDKFSDTYFVSHYIYKDFDKLAKSDTNRVCGNWQRIEVDGDDY